mmetsp:Transcript_127907/g.368473  ORF Transcript_127907/g.368473 Transcript_127907/m.368473 type:complete len:341 (-) Transcript_127907:1049-2071(-)
MAKRAKADRARERCGNIRPQRRSETEPASSNRGATAAATTNETRDDLMPGLCYRRFRHAQAAGEARCDRRPHQETPSPIHHTQVRRKVSAMDGALCMLPTSSVCSNVASLASMAKDSRMDRSRLSRSPAKALTSSEASRTASLSRALRSPEVKGTNSCAQASTRPVLEATIVSVDRNACFPISFPSSRACSTAAVRLDISSWLCSKQRICSFSCSHDNHLKCFTRCSPCRPSSSLALSSSRCGADRSNFCRTTSGICLYSRRRSFAKRVTRASAFKVCALSCKISVCLPNRAASVALRWMSCCWYRWDWSSRAPRISCCCSQCSSSLALRLSSKSAFLSL